MRRSFLLPIPILLPVVIILSAGLSCMKNPSDFPEVEGYDGFIELGWQAIQQDEYLDAFEYFQQAIDIDVTRADGFLGAAISTLFLEDYWDQGDDYFQAAIQQDLGRSIVVQHLEEVQIQDTLWTVFQCVDPDLPQDSLDIWLSLTADSGEVWVGQKIHDYLTSNGFSTDLIFRFSPEYDNPVACLEIYQAQSGTFYSSDSTASGYVFVTIPVYSVRLGPGYYRHSWIEVGPSIIYDYAAFDLDGYTGQITLDALAGWLMLQEVQSAEGDLLQAIACAYGLLQVAPNYQFGADDPDRESVFDTDIVDVAASGASCAFNKQKYIYSWFMCKQVGYGLDLDPLSENFLLYLLELLLQMKG